MPKSYGYARVSTREQNEGRQVAALLEQGIARRDIFVDKKSGKDFDRPKYRRLIRRLKPGDVLFVKSIDRLGRNYDEILEQWRVITKERGVFIMVLDMPLLDTRHKHEDITGTLIADIVLQLLSYLAQKEREFIRQRQAEGIAVAKACGVKFGRPPKERPDTFFKLYEQWQNGETSARAAARELGITHRTFGIWANQESTAVALAGSSAALNG
jgi:DNA invertase Pin-like site-specific DNA recombinase